MENKEHRRKSKRHPVRWKAAVVFDKADGKPVVHTETQDLSVGGTAIYSNYGDLTGTVVTLLLAQPVRHGGEAPKMLKIRARVVSSMQSPSTSGFRHGLSFVEAKDDALDVLAQILGAEESGRAGGAAPAAPATPPAAAGSSRLAKLKQLALEKQSAEKKPEQQADIDARVSGAMERAYRFLKEFTDQLNIVNPAYAKEYSIVGVPNFDDLAWERGHIDLRTRETSPITKVYEKITLEFKLSAKKQLRVTRDSPADEKLRQMLLETRIGFSAQQERNERGSIVRTTFAIPCEIKAYLELIGKFDTGKLLLRTSNIGNFGTMEHVLAPEAVTEEALDEFTGFILGESSRIGPLLLKNA
jgi:hypothetical protein